MQPTVVMEPAKRLEELVTWQLACALRDAVEEVVDSGSAARDFELKDQILASSRSGASNVAEGFGHIRPRQFARHLRIARASVMETANHVHAGAKKHFSQADKLRLLTLVKRTLGAIRRLLEYLDSCPRDFDWRNPRKDGRARKSRKPRSPKKRDAPPAPENP
jgi:four helix bundle protein